MILGAHSATFVKEWGENIIPYINKIVEIGYKSVEVSLLGHDDKSAEKIGQLSNDLGVEITCTTGLSSDQDITSKDKEICKRGINALKNSLLLTKKMNSSLLSGVIFGPWGISKKPGDNKKEKLINSSESIKLICKELEDLKINLGIEPLNRYETDILNTTEEGLELCEKIDHPKVGLLLDTYHMNIEQKDICKTIILAKDKIYHFHIAENDRGIPGTGSLNWDKIFQTLKLINYNKHVTLEMFIQAFVSTSKDLFTWRNIEKSPEIAIKESFNYLQKFFN